MNKQVVRREVVEYYYRDKNLVKETEVTVYTADGPVHEVTITTIKKPK